MRKKAAPKTKVEKMPPDAESAGSLARDAIRRHAAPSGRDEFMLESLADVLAADSPDKAALTAAGAWLVALIRNLSEESCARMFREILAMKSRMELPPARQSHALRACAIFIRDEGRPPSKPELKEFILARADTYGDIPTPEDKKGWYRLWKDTHLDGLSSR